MIRQVTTTIFRQPCVRRHVASITVLQPRRNLVTKPSPGRDPLDVLQKECMNRKLCDASGYRKPGVHWVVSIATQNDNNAPPNLRTVGVQRISSAGIDFVVKKGLHNNITSDQPVSVLLTKGEYVPGQTAKQWRGEGHCGALPLSQVLDYVPHYSITGMVVSKRIEQEILDSNKSGDVLLMKDADISVDRLEVPCRSHVTEITQKTRLELENNQLSQEELEHCIQAFRFYPDRFERMAGGPDSVMWERWEWLRSFDDSPAEVEEEDGAMSWNSPKQLLPH